METRKRAYHAPEAEKIEFDFREQVVTASGLNPGCYQYHPTAAQEYREFHCYRYSFDNG